MADDSICTIVVSNVPPEAKESELRVFFRFHGDIKEVQYSNAERTSVLIEYTKPDEAESALLFNDTTFHGCVIKVDLFNQSSIPEQVSAPEPEPEPAFEEPATFEEFEIPSVPEEAPVSPAKSPSPAPVVSPVKPSVSRAPHKTLVSEPVAETAFKKAPEADDATLAKLTLLSPFDTANSVLVVVLYFSYLCVGSVF
eukprot:TRINITY_DN4933_c0_g1_i5.p1 TRINITY_DN4933_c0_g1~~TRINITY_DN4933_c0_g1_i5.p1  ORF type:complete len:197 (-),score=49.62 TRINITY_DN4933_c0_g1_i5:145-735(-)